MIEDSDHEHDFELDDESDESDEEADRDFERRVARRQPGGDVELLLHELRDLLDQARPAPLSTAVKVDRDAMLDLVEQALERLPEDLRQARWQLKEREEFLARTQREADEILAAARGQSERMVQRSEVMRSAESKARRIVEQARADAARLRSECDDYCDQRLAQLEAVLEKTMTVIARGRERLRPPPADESPGYPEVSDDPTTELGQEEAEAAGAVFFDQDLDHDPAS
jgi:cell division septum initiation protein DivIVA